MAGLLEYTKNGQVTEPPLYRFMRGNVQSFLNSIPDPSKMTPEEQLNLGLNANPVMGLLGTVAKNKNVYSLLEQQNKSTTPKIPTGNIFQNEAIQLPSSKRKTIDEIIGKGKESSLPSEYVDVSQIVPTQKNVTIPNLKSVKNVPTDEAIAVKDNGMYYLIDGHHRVANQILNNNNNVKIRVLE
jgi:hypothetical protein